MIGNVYRKDGPCDWWKVSGVQLPEIPGYDGGLPGVSVRVSRPTRLRRDGTWGQRWSNPVFVVAKSKKDFERKAADGNRRLVGDHMNRIKIVAVACALALSSACASSKYAVVPADPEARDISFGSVKLVSIQKDGYWKWHKAPEEVVNLLLGVVGGLDKELVRCQAELKKYAPKVKAAKPEKVAK